MRWTVRKTAFALLLSAAAGYSGSGMAGNWLPTQSSSDAGIREQLQNAHWVADGPKTAKKVIYVFTDPDCPFCNELWKAMQAAHPSDIQVRYLLVAVIDEDSRGKDAAILESADPAQALRNNERKFDSGGISPKHDVQRTTNEAIALNESLMRGLRIYGTPGTVYWNSSGNLKVFAGMPNSQQLRDILDLK